MKDYSTADTIAAIATFPARSGLGVIKISGNKALAIVSKIFVPKKKKDILKAKTYSLHYGWIVDNHHKKPYIIDEVLVSIMRTPHSYTRQDVVEISSHGGSLVLNKILELILKGGARSALPGEFTYRAFLSGRLDLLQAKSILDIVEAKTPQALRLATEQLKGRSSQRLLGLRSKLKGLYVRSEAELNFPEEGLETPFLDFQKRLKEIARGLNEILEVSQKTLILKEGFSCVICGKANVGKSTLFNCLLNEERVIVSEIPGTTRDVVEETVMIKGIPLRIYDTAGILKAKDLITRKAMEKTQEAFSKAQLILFVLDGSKALEREDYFFLERITQEKKRVILIINKSDLRQRLKLKEEFKGLGPVVHLSALKGEGLQKLKSIIFKMVSKDNILQEGFFLNPYQIQILKEVIISIEKALKFLAQKQSLDFVSFSLKEALEDLGKITGEVFCEEVLESIFSNFCIGK